MAFSTEHQRASYQLNKSKDYNGFRGYETWTDKDGDKTIWELLDTPLALSVLRLN